VLTFFTALESLLTKLNHVLAPFDKLVTVLMKVNSLITKVNHVMALAEVMQQLWTSANNVFTVYNNLITDLERSRNGTASIASFGNKIKVMANNETTVSNKIDVGVKGNDSKNILNLTDEELDEIIEEYLAEEVVRMISEVTNINCKNNSKNCKENLSRQ